MVDIWGRGLDGNSTLITSGTTAKLWTRSVRSQPFWQNTIYNLMISQIVKLLMHLQTSFRIVVYLWIFFILFVASMSWLKRSCFIFINNNKIFDFLWQLPQKVNDVQICLMSFTSFLINLLLLTINYPITWERRGERERGERR